MEIKLEKLRNEVAKLRKELKLKKKNCDLLLNFLSPNH